MAVTPSPMVTLVNLFPLNAPLEDILQFTINSPVQPLKASSPILVTLSGMVMEVRLLQPENA